MSNGAPFSLKGKAADRHPAAGRYPDPVPGLRFLVKIGTEPIGRFSECSGLQVEYETMDWPEGGENRFIHKLRGRTKYQNLVLKRGITYEKNLIQWFRDCADRTKRFPVTVELIAGDAKTVRKFSFDMAFPVKWTGPNLNASQNNAAIETLEIAHHGFSEL